MTVPAGQAIAARLQSTISIVLLRSALSSVDGLAQILCLGIPVVLAIASPSIQVAPTEVSLEMAPGTASDTPIQVRSAGLLPLT